MTDITLSAYQALFSTGLGLYAVNVFINTFDEDISKLRDYSSNLVQSVTEKLNSIQKREDEITENAKNSVIQKGGSLEDYLSTEQIDEIKSIDRQKIQFHGVIDWSNEISIDADDEINKVKKFVSRTQNISIALFFYCLIALLVTTNFSTLELEPKINGCANNIVSTLNNIFFRDVSWIILIPFVIWILRRDYVLSNLKMKNILMKNRLHTIKMK
ncbi:MULTISPECIES: hypothetical protein [unclassified Gluconobacter]|uniref:hypothetical protein n=1 Tax=unclassified Gluconobacter TaxID=2644261 RepID=UPI001C05DC8D|nr:MULTISPECIES: hypothetical protein [unclassified Gluconobacter]